MVDAPGCMQSGNATLFMVCGKIAAGKSTLARRLAVESSGMLFSEDDWLSRLFPGEITTLDDYRDYSARLRTALKPHIVQLLKSNLNVVMDFPANTLKQRKQLREIFELAGAAYELHYLDAPDDVCKSRLKKRNDSGQHEFQTSESEFDLFTSYFTPPTAEEGLNVFTHKPDQFSGRPDRR